MKCDRVCVDGLEFCKGVRGRCGSSRRACRGCKCRAARGRRGGRRGWGRIGGCRECALLATRFGEDPEGDSHRLKVLRRDKVERAVCVKGVLVERLNPLFGLSLLVEVLCNLLDHPVERLIGLPPCEQRDTTIDTERGPASHRPERDVRGRPEDNNTMRRFFFFFVSDRPSLCSCRVCARSFVPARGFGMRNRPSMASRDFVAAWSGRTLGRLWTDRVALR